MSLILDVQLYDSGVGKDKSLAFEPKFRAKNNKEDNIIHKINRWVETCLRQVKSFSSSPTAQYADFMSMLEIARTYPDRLPPEVVIENSNLANKEVIVQQIESVERGQKSVVSGQKKTKKETSKPFRPTVDFVNNLRR